MTDDVSHVSLATGVIFIGTVLALVPLSILTIPIVVFSAPTGPSIIDQVLTGIAIVVAIGIYGPFLGQLSRMGVCKSKLAVVALIAASIALGVAGVVPSVTTGRRAVLLVASTIAATIGTFAVIELLGYLGYDD